LIIAGGTPVNEAEELVIDLLDKHEDGWIAVHNVDIPFSGADEREIDIVVITDHSVVLVDVKGGRGPVTAAGPRWLQGSAYANPAKKIRENAKRFSSWLVEQDERLGRIHVDGLVVLAGENARLADPEGQDHRVTIPVEDLFTTLEDEKRRGNRAPTRIYRDEILRALTKLIGPVSGLPVFGRWKVIEAIGAIGASEWISEFRAADVLDPKSKIALLQVHSTPRAMADDERQAHIARVRNGYDTLRDVEPHPRIIRFLDCFQNPGEDEVVVVMDDHAPYTAGESHPELIVDLLEGLSHLHAHDTLHRAICPDALVVNAEGRGVITRFHYARTGPSRGVRSLDGDALLDASGDPYVAPECMLRPDRLSTRSDVYAAGVLAFELATGAQPAELDDPWGRLADLLGPQRAEIVRAMCAEDPTQRPTAAHAFRVFSAEPEPDYARLPAGFKIDKYEVVDRLGEPGSHAVVYHVHDTIEDGKRVLKLFHRDLARAKARVLTEYSALREVRHPAIARPVHTNLYDRAIPYLVFEYTQGVSLAELGRIEPEEVRRFGEQLAKGLEALHAKGVHHRDITPWNVLWTGDDCTIIDFDLAVRAGERAVPGVGTPRYLPPDQPAGRDLTPGELADQDVYGLAVCLYEAATGDYPWETEVPLPGVLPRRVGVGDLADVLHKALSPERGGRFATAAELYSALHYGLREPRSDRLPRLLVVDDHHTGSIIKKLGPDYDCLPLDSKPEWDRFLRDGGVLDFDGAIVDLHLSEQSLGEGVDILRYLCNHTDIPTAVITMNTGETDDDENASFRHQYRAVRLEHKKDDKWWGNLREIAVILTAETGEGALRRVLAVLDSARYWMQLRTAEASPDGQLWSRRAAFYREYDEVEALARRARTVGEFRDLNRRSLRLWREWYEDTAEG
jgi:serine/threonine protein kinase